ncbi:MAG: FecR domain-containing protein [Chitinophagaceae bacterium]|nr:FecR domain-containing protein [Chitinophagaceae bacterium]
MNESIIRKLLKLYESGEATDEQRRLVEEYLAWRQQQRPERKKDESDLEASLQEFMDRRRLLSEQDAGDEGTPVETNVYSMPEAGNRRRNTWIVAAAGIVVVFAAGLLWKMTTRHHEEAPVAIVYKTVQAAPGKMIHLLLSDSSEVWLNAGARIRYPQPFEGTIRRLQLLDGEAFFQVHPDASRGFEVQTEYMLTKALGTSFDIKAYRESQQMSVALASGKVSVTTKTSGAPIVLTPEQQVKYNTGTGLMSRGALASNRMRNWKEEEIFDFNEDQLGDIAIELEHYFNVHIQFKYPGIKKYTFSATFPHTMPLKKILTSLCVPNQNHLTQLDAQHYVIH